MSDELFTEAMIAYDNADRHSIGIRTIIGIVQKQTRRDVESDFERFPLLQRVRELTVQLSEADERALRLRQTVSEARKDRDDMAMVVVTLRAELALLDSKRNTAPEGDVGDAGPRGLR